MDVLKLQELIVCLGDQRGHSAVLFPEHVRRFVDSLHWTFAKTYAATWPHEYVTRNEANACLLLDLARHILVHGVEGPFYSHVYRYYHEAGKVYWCMAPTPEAAELVNRCDEAGTYEARAARGDLPRASRRQLKEQPPIADPSDTRS